MSLKVIKRYFKIFEVGTKENESYSMIKNDKKGGCLPSNPVARTKIKGP